MEPTCESEPYGDEAYGTFAGQKIKGLLAALEAAAVEVI